MEAGPKPGRTTTTRASGRWLDRTLELKQRYVDCFPATDDPYDVLLDDFEPGMHTDEVRRVFERLEPALRELTAAAADDEPEPFLSGPYARDAQHELSLEVARAFGAADAVLPARPDGPPLLPLVRDTRHPPDDPLRRGRPARELALLDDARGRTRPLRARRRRRARPDAARDGLLVGAARVAEPPLGERDRPLAAVLALVLPAVPRRVREALADVPLERFHRAVNRPRPSFIRVDADETTYGLHIILRFQLEQELLFGGLSTADVPEAWNTRMEELVGIRPPNDRVGCLQDVHWSGGMFGYFPTYQLGNVLSAQIWERLVSDLPDAYEHVEQGSFGEIYEWLREHLYRHGRKFTPRR